MYITDIETDRIRFTSKGVKRLTPLFARYGMQLANITSRQDLERAIAHLPQYYQNYAKQDLREAAMDNPSPKDVQTRLEMAIITRDSEAFPELIRQMAKFRHKP